MLVPPTAPILFIPQSPFFTPPPPLSLSPSVFFSCFINDLSIRSNEWGQSRPKSAIRNDRFTASQAHHHPIPEFIPSLALKLNQISFNPLQSPSNESNVISLMIDTPLYLPYEIEVELDYRGNTIAIDMEALDRSRFIVSLSLFCLYISPFLLLAGIIYQWIAISAAFSTTFPPKMAPGEIWATSFCHL